MAKPVELIRRSLREVQSSSDGQDVARIGYHPVDGAWLGAFRILFGGLMVMSMIRFLAYGWVERFFVEPQMHFKYWGFSWVQPLEGPAMTWMFYGLTALAACMALGLFFRVTALSFTAGLFYFQLIDVSTYLNHYYLAALLSLLLALSPAGRVWSLDAWLARRRSAPDTRIPALWLYLFRAQVGTVYFFAGLAKLNADWLLHAQPLRIWLGTNTDLPILGPLFTIEGVPLLMSWAGFLFDLTIVLWLSLRRTRLAAYAVVIIFHAMTRLLFPIGMFPFIMTAAALVFFEPSWPRVVARKLQGWTAQLPKSAARLRASIAKLQSSTARSASSARAESATASPRPVPPTALASDAAAPYWADTPAWKRRISGAAAITYCAIQLLVPLRFVAYEGNVMWHEQGMRFAWRVMLRAKGGSASFVVRDGATGRETVVSPRHYLTDLQEAEMVSQPDLILQLAHHIRDDYEQRGFRNVEVRVESHVSLNGRRSARLVDPTANLAQLSDGLAPLHWVERAPAESPHHTKPVL